MVLWKQAKAKIMDVINKKKPDFMVYLGDLPTHGIPDATRRTYVTTMLNDLDTLQTNIPILYLPGNNDSPGGDYHSFTDTKSGTAINPFTGSLNSNGNWPVINEQSSNTKISNVDYNDEFGYYSAAINMGAETLNVIALNTVIFCHPSQSHSSLRYVGDDGIDQYNASIDQFSWFRKKLNGYASTDRVMIMMHIPPGAGGYSYHMWNDTLTVYVDDPGSPGTDTMAMRVQNAFLHLVGKNKDKITGILTAHTHLDGLRRMYYTNNSTGHSELAAVSISTPGITPYHSNNPGFKIIEYEPSTFNLTDFETYFATPNSRGTKFKFHPDSTYTFKETYGAVGSSKNIFEVIRDKKHSYRIIPDMKKIMYLHNKNGGSGFNYHRALTVYPN